MSCANQDTNCCEALKEISLAELKSFLASEFNNMKAIIEANNISLTNQLNMIT